MAAGDAAVGVTFTLASNNNSLLNDTSQSLLPPKTPGLKPTITSDVLSDYPPQYVSPEGIKTECNNPTGEEKDSLLSHPTGGGKDSVYSNPTGGGKDSLFTHPTGGGKDSLCTVKENEPNSVEEFRRAPFNPKTYRRRIQTTLQGVPKTVQDTLHNQRLRRLQQTKCLVDCYSRLTSQRRNRHRSKTRQSGFLQSLVPGSKTRQPLEASNRPKLSQQIPGHIKVQDGNSRIHMSFPQKERMGHLYRPHRRLPPHTHSPSVTQVPPVLPQRRLLQFTSLPFGLATAPLIFTSIVKEVRLLALQQGIRIHQYLDDWLIRAPSKEECHQQTQKLLNLIQELGFLVNHKKSELVPSQRFDFLGYHFLLDLGLVKPTQDRWTKLQDMFRRLSSKSVISARTLMSTIGLLASTEKTVKLGRMHMRPFQWHLKTHWKYPIPWNQKMIRHGEWWLDPTNVLQGEFLHPREHEKLIFTDASNAGWGAHLDHESTRGVWSHAEKHLHINLLEMKAVFLALQFFRLTCKNNRVFIASDNTSVVSYINKQGGTRSAELCALMWRILTWCNLNNVTLRARHVPGSLNVIADGLSRRNQIQSTEWSLSPQVFKQISKIWESPQVDLFATRLNTKLPLYVSPIPDPQAWAVDALNIPWENLVAYAYPPTALLPKVVQKLQSQMCRLLLIAPGWPSKPWFWDLVEMSLDVPRRLPQIRTLLKQPMNNLFHANPASLNLHVWYLGAHRCNNEGSLQRWQREMLLLKGSQQEPSTPQNGLFSNDGAWNNRWTSGVPL